MTDPSARVELLRAARAVQQSAATGDLGSLHDEMCRLRNALVEHEVAASVGVSDSHRRVIRHGRRRLLRYIDELLATTRGEGEGGDACTCLVRGAELRSLLVRQLRLEAGLRVRDEA